MKKNSIILTLFLVAVFALVSFKLKSNKQKLMSNSYYVYYTTNLNTNAPDFANVLADALNTVTPQFYTSNPSPDLGYGGFTNSSDYTNDGDCTVGYMDLGDQSIAMACKTYTSSSEYTEFDIAINSGWSGFLSWGNGYSNTYDRETVLMKNLCMGVGLAEVGRSPLRIMSSPYYSTDGPISISQDEKDGFACLYDGDQCQYDEDGCSNMKISTRIINNISKKTLKWTIETENNSIKGFNVFMKTGSKYVSLNKEMIEIANNQNYSFKVNNSIKKEGEYYLEVIYNKNKRELLSFENIN